MTKAVRKISRLIGIVIKPIGKSIFPTRKVTKAIRKEIFPTE